MKWQCFRWSTGSKEGIPEKPTYDNPAPVHASPWKGAFKDSGWFEVFASDTIVLHMANDKNHSVIEFAVWIKEVI